MYGFEEVKQGGNGANLKFGLNQKVFLKSFAFNPSGGANGTASNVADITLLVGGKEVRTRVFEINMPKDRNLVAGTPEYTEALNNDRKKMAAYLCSFVTCFVTKEQLQQALSQPIASFESYIQVLSTAIMRTPNWQNLPLDLFCQYQYSIAQGKEQTYLEIPKTVGYGSIICPHVPGNFVEERTDTVLQYRDTVTGNLHPFQRSEFFLQQPSATKQTLTKGQESSAYAAPVYTASTNTATGGW